MTYVRRVLADVPYGIWTVDGSTLTDSGGSGRTGELITPANYRSANTLVAGGGSAMTLGSNTQARFPFPGFQPGYEFRPFTLETWFAPVGSNPSVNILGHDAALDGLWFDGSAVHFTTKYADASSADTKYVLEDTEAYHVVGVHTESRNSLYVNGNLVSEVDITDAQKVAGYAAVTNGTWIYSGYSAGTALISIDTPAIYAVALQPRKIYSHFVWGRQVRTLSQVVESNAGYYFDFTDNEADIYLSKTWDTTDEWNEGISTGVSIEDGVLQPDLDTNGNPINGEWVGTLNLSTLDPAHTVNSARLYWSGSGNFTVSVSVDNMATFTSITNGALISAITAGYLTENKSIDIKVVFNSDATALLDSLSCVVYKTNTIVGSTAIRTATINGAVRLSPENHEPLENNDVRGAKFTGGYIQVAADATETPVSISSIELWVKFDSLAAASTIVDLRAVGSTGNPRMTWNGTAMSTTGFDSVYVNGSATLPSTWRTGVWYHIVLSLNAPVNLTFRLGQDYLGANPLIGQIGSMALYPTNLNAPLSLEAYSRYFGIVLNSIDDAGLITLAEEEFRLYSHDWSITSAG